MANSGEDVIDGGGVEKQHQLNCFFVTPIGDEASEVRKRSNYVRTYILDEALGPLHYKISRSDLVDASGDITQQIVDQLLNADLVVADLSDRNPNVYYELALRHAFARPFIHIAQKGEPLPFDISHQRTVFYDLTDLPSVYAAKASVRSAAEEILRGGNDYKVVSPVTRAVDLDQLRRSDDPEQVAMADIKDSVASLQADLRGVRRLIRETSYSSGGGFTPIQASAVRELLVRLAEEALIDRKDLLQLELVPPTRAWVDMTDAVKLAMDPYSRASKNQPNQWVGSDDEPPF